MIKYSTPEGFFGNAFARIGEQFSVEYPPKEFTVVHPALKSLVRFIYSFYHSDDPKVVKHPNITVAGTGLFDSIVPKFKLNPKDKRCLIGFSGGKDSIATVLKLRKLGYKVEGVHVRHINKSVLGEENAAVSVAGLMGIPLHVLPFTSTGFSYRWESPVKNLIILGMMLDFGGPKGIAHYALGTEDDDWNDIDRFQFDMDVSDCKDTLDVGAAVCRLIPGFTLHRAMISAWASDSYRTILTDPKGMDYLRASMSCQMRHQYLGVHHKRVCEKYKVKLMDNRCGCCWKCAVEFIFLSAYGMVKENKRYLEYCWGVLNKSSLKNQKRTLDFFKEETEAIRKSKGTL